MNLRFLRLFALIITLISAILAHAQRGDLIVERPPVGLPARRACDATPVWHRHIEPRIIAGDGYCLGAGATMATTVPRATGSAAVSGLGPLSAPRGLFVAFATDCDESNISFLLDVIAITSGVSGMKTNVLVHVDEERRFFDELTSNGVVSVPAHVNVILTPQKPDFWMQDVMEAGIDERGRVTILDLAYGRGGGGHDRRGDVIPSQIQRVCRDGMGRVVGPDVLGGAQAGGAIEFIPGLLIAGTATEPLLTSWLGVEEPHEIFRVNTTWLDVGHVDELLAVVPAVDSPCGVAILRASPARAFHLIRRQPSLTIDTPLPAVHATGRQWRPEPGGCLRGIPVAPAIAETQGGRVFWCSDLISANERYEELIADAARQLQQVLQSRLGCSAVAIEALPMLFRPQGPRRSYGGVTDHAYGMNPNPVNLVVLGETVLVPQQYHEGFASDIRTTLRGLGLRPRSVDDRFYHFRGGNAHCATQVLRN